VEAERSNRRRAAMAGWDEENWYSRYQLARLAAVQGHPAPDVTHAYLAAYEARPRRAEPLIALARWHRLRGEWALAYLYARAATE